MKHGANSNVGNRHKEIALHSADQEVHTDYDDGH